MSTILPFPHNVRLAKALLRTVPAPGAPETTEADLLMERVRQGDIHADFLRKFRP